MKTETILSIGLETTDNSIQLINQDGEAIAAVTYNPLLETAQDIINRYNHYENIVIALDHLITMIEAKGSKAVITNAINIGKKAIGQYDPTAMV